MNRAVLAEVLVGVVGALSAAGCSRPVPPPPGILVVTTPAGTDLSGVDESLVEVVRFDTAYAHARQARPALASLWTGTPPHDHGLTDPVLHQLNHPTVADELQQAGWTTCRAFETPALLTADESWGFQRVGRCTGAKTLTWLHTPDPVEAIRAWQAESPGGTVLLTGLPADRPLEQGGGRVPLFWIGAPERQVRTDLVGQGAIADAIRRLAQPAASDRPRPPLFPTVDLPRVESVDALPRLAAGGPVVWVERTPAGIDVESIALPSPTDRVLDPWPPAAGLPTDPLGQLEGMASAATLDLLHDAQQALARGRHREARDLLERTRSRVGPTVAGEVLMARLEWRSGEPRAALDRLQQLHQEQPSASSAARLGHLALELRRPDLAAPWFDAVLAEFPDHAPTLAARVRCARAAGSTALADALAGRLWSVDPHWAARAAVRDALDRKEPVPADWVALLAASPDPVLGTDPEIRLLRARIDWQAGRWNAGLDALDALLRDDPRHIDARLTAATWALELGDVDRASRLLAPVHRWFPDDLRVSALSALTLDALAEERSRLQWLRGVWRNRP